MRPTKAPPALTAAAANNRQDDKPGVPSGVPIAATVIFLTAAGKIAWDKWGRQKAKDMAGEAIWTAKTATLIGVTALGVGGMVYGGAMMAGAITMTPGLTAATVGGGTMATGGAVAINGAVLAEGATWTALGANALKWGRSLMTGESKKGVSSSGEPSASNPKVSEHPSSDIKKPSAKDPELQKRIDQLFQPSDTKPGGTGGAVREELLTGQPTKGKFHSTKAEEAINAINNLLRRRAKGNGPPLDKVDQETALALKQQLQDAINSAPKAP